MQQAVAQVRDQATAERDAAVAAALEQTAILQREQFGMLALAAREQTNSDLSAKKDVIDARLDQVHAEMRTELTKLSEMVTTLGRVERRELRQRHVSRSPRTPRSPTPSPTPPGHCVRRSRIRKPAATGANGWPKTCCASPGSSENLNYVKQTQIEGGTGRPDYTFPMPKGHALYMDVKFPMASYLRYLEVDTNAEREVHLKRFLQDVRLRVKELAKRDYSGESDQPSVDYVLLFIPNEQLTGFIHEHDAALLDEAMGQKVVLCSPLTLFAFLGVIRQAFDNFMIEQTSDEILQLLGTFSAQWRKYDEAGRLGEEAVRPGRSGLRTAHRPSPAPARTAPAPARGAAPATQSARSTGSSSRPTIPMMSPNRRHRDATRRHDQDARRMSAAGHRGRAPRPGRTA